MMEFFSTKIGHQTIACIVTLLSMPFLYLGGTQHNSGLLAIGLIMMLFGMLAVPVINFIHTKKGTNQATH